ncbi:unnamed protein product, partial [Effrenium voratum]
YSPIICKATLYMRGFYLKAAQLVSTRDDFLPEIYLEWCRKLQDEVPMSITSEEAKRVVAQELKIDRVDQLLTDWEDEPIGTASIGQVYKARLKSSNQEVAIKVQVPNAERMFRADITCLKMFTYLAIPWAYEQMREIEKMFQSEFDYLAEFRNLEAMRSNLLPSWGHKIYIPRPIPELQGRRVIGMELLKGEKFISAVRRRLQPLAEREGKSVEEYEKEQTEALRSGKRKAESAAWLHWKVTLWRWWRWVLRRKDPEPVDVGGIFDLLMSIHGQQVLQDGCFNADPHPGNILLLEDGKTLGLIDFGQVAYISQDFRLRLARLMLALANRDKALVARYESHLPTALASNAPGSTGMWLLCRRKLILCTSLNPHGAMRLALLFLRGAAGGPWSYTLVHPPKQLAFCYVSTSGGRWKGKVASQRMVHFFNLLNRVQVPETLTLWNEHISPEELIFWQGSTPVGQKIPEPGRGWRFAAFVRDPLERYVSAFLSKCVPGPDGVLEDNGRHCCFAAYGKHLTGEQLIEAFERRVIRDAKMRGPCDNMHWRPQVECLAMCGPQFHDTRTLDFLGVISAFHGRPMKDQVYEMLSMANVTQQHVEKVFGSQPDQHARDAGSFFQKFFRNITILCAALSLYQIDYLQLGLPLILSEEGARWSQEGWRCESGAMLRW